MKLKTVRDAMHKRQSEQPKQNPVEAHWRCQDCGIACYCTGDARGMLHARCGRRDDE